MNGGLLSPERAVESERPSPSSAARSREDGHPGDKGTVGLRATKARALSPFPTW